MSATQSIFCWGSNASGQLGDGTTSDRLSPVAVANGTNAFGVAAGHDHSCFWAVGGANSCWGNNTLGALGNGTTTSANTPVRVVY